MAGADWRAGKIEEYQSQHVPIRSRIRALGLEGFGAAEAIWDIEQLPKDSSQVVAHESRVSTSEWVTVGLGNVQGYSCELARHQNCTPFSEQANVAFHDCVLSQFRASNCAPHNRIMIWYLILV